jgi:hypothetical protein
MRENLAVRNGILRMWEKTNDGELMGIDEE